MSYFFSIIIPVYNTEQYLPRALDSILKQTSDIKKIEVIVVNDGSPKIKQCDKIIEKYSSKLSIKYIRNEVNQGTHIARKLGVKNCDMCEGYALFLDPDDFFESNALSILYEDIQKNGDADYIEYCFSGLKNNIKTSNFNSVNKQERTIENVLSSKQNHNVCNKCFKISFIKNIYANMPDFYAYYSEDYYQIGIIEYYAKKKRFIKKALYVYFWGIGVTSTNKYEKEKLKKILLSLYNVEVNLVDFYKKQNADMYIPLIHSFSEKLYGDAMFCSNIEDFIEASREMLDNERMKNIFIYAIPKYEDRIAFLEKRVKLLTPIKIILKPIVFIYRYLKNIYKQNKS